MKHAHVRVHVVAETAGRDPRDAYILWDDQDTGLDVEDHMAQLGDPVCAEHGELLPCESGCRADQTPTLDT